MEAEGLAFTAIFFPEFRESEVWRGEAFRRLNSEINIQVYPDGYQRELAMSYHAGCIDWFLRTLNLAVMNGFGDAFPESYLRVVEKMCEVPVKMTFPDGSSTQFGDSWAGEPGMYYGRIRKWAEMFGREDFLYVSSGGSEGVIPDSTAWAMPISGFYSMRSGWDEDAVCLVLKCGPDGGGHCHPDNGSFELYAGGRHLMPDAGSYIYSGDPEGRRWFRQTRVHQTLTLNGADSDYAPGLLLWKPGENLDVLVVENDSYPGLTHRRAVMFVEKKYFIIIDEASGEATGNIDLHFQLAPGRAVFDHGRFLARSDFAEGWNVMVQAMPRKRMKMAEEEGQVSFVYGEKEKRPAFCYSIRKEKVDEIIRFVTVVFPYQGIQPEVKVKTSGKTAPGSRGIRLKVRSGRSFRRIGYDLQNERSAFRQ
jgi:heparan-sulfate lyase